MVVLLSLLLVVSLASSGIHASDSRISNGRTAQPGQFPYAALLRSIRNNSPRLCGGSLLNRQWVLTSASCLQGTRIVDVVLGSTNGSAPTTALSREFVRHENFSRPTTLANDIALVKLPENVTYSSLIQPVELPSGHSMYLGQTPVLTGWGGRNSMELTSPTLQYANLTIVENSVCEEQFGKGYRYTNLCTHDPDTRQSPCQRDIGDPLVLDGTQIGIYSRLDTKSNCEGGFPSAYTRVTEYVDWIRRYTG